MSNALYAAAIAAGCEIVERHRHSRVVPGSLAEVDLDATIFWNYVDLRFRPAVDLVIEAQLMATDLVLNLRRANDSVEQTVPDTAAAANQPSARSPAAGSQVPPGDCLSCGETRNQLRLCHPG